MISFDDPEFVERVDGMGFDEQDVADLRTAVSTVTAEEFAAVEHAAAALIARLDREPEPSSKFWTEPDLPGRPMGLVAMLTFIVTASEVAARQAERGLPIEVSLATLADLGGQARVHRQAYGVFGLHTQEWLMTVWSGRLYALGRLQFELIADPSGPDGFLLSVHIPATGPLTPAAVDDALGRARAFFPLYFPERPVTGFFCRSWLLDPELAVRLPDTNLAAFQRRWELTGDHRPGDTDTLFFVFHRRGPVGVDELPTTTRLERATVELLREGRSWELYDGQLPW